jgi:hypothetical protein
MNRHTSKRKRARLEKRELSLEISGDDGLIKNLEVQHSVQIDVQRQNGSDTFSKGCHGYALA